MVEEKRERARRSSDRLIRQTVEFHRAIVDIMEGRGGDLDSVLKMARQMGVGLGRREEDRRLVELLSAGLEGLARRLVELGVIEQVPRKVRLRKVLGKSDEKFPVGMEKLGWEMDLPKVGERYCLYLDDGRVFRTGEVLEYGEGHFRTRNSVYEIQRVEEGGSSNGAKSGETLPQKGQGLKTG
ncbi:MAG: hypothetical protein ACUVXD_09330 [Thermodesulfobacteriota bacterium]